MIIGILLFFIGISWVGLGLYLVYGRGYGNKSFVDKLDDKFGLWIIPFFWFVFNIPTCFIIAFSLVDIIGGLA